MADFDRELLRARLEELSRKSEQGYVTRTSFLTPAELLFAESLKIKNAFPFGGFKNPERERKCVFFIPDYYDAVTDGMTEAEKNNYIADNVIEDGPVAVKIVGSGFKKLSHRDYLGSVLAMGIERSAIGDVCVTGEHEAVAFALPKVAELLCFGLERIGSDKVKVSIMTSPDDFSFERKTAPLTDTIASDRFDCVIAALCRKSRSVASELITSGLAELNYVTCERTDAKITEGDIISVRGFGKFTIKAISDETKKGRIRLEAEKYI